MNNRSALTLKLARSLNKMPSSIGTTSDSSNDWLVVSEEVAETEGIVDEQEQFIVQPEQTAEQSLAGFQEDEMPSNRPNKRHSNFITIMAIVTKLQLKLGQVNVVHQDYQLSRIWRMKQRSKTMF